MPAIHLELLGTVHPDGTFDLDQKLTIPPGRVKVRVESMEAPAPRNEGLVEFVRRARRDLEAAGHRFRTGEAIDAELAELRDEWEQTISTTQPVRSGTRQPPALQCGHDQE